ncbi:unnamed protein product, partial [Symbiodinium microadriaticum]
MVGSGEVASEQAAAARGDDEPTPAESDQAGRIANDLERRRSWATSWGNYSTDASSHYARSWNGNEADDGFGGGDNRRGDLDLFEQASAIEKESGEIPGWIVERESMD